MNQLRILVADDHEIVRRGICELLKAHTGWQICGQAADGRAAVEQVNQLRPDIVILDIGMPNLNGIDAARQILRNNPLQRRLILSISDAEEVWPMGGPKRVRQFERTFRTHDPRGDGSVCEGGRFASMVRRRRGCNTSDSRGGSHDC